MAADLSVAIIFKNEIRCLERCLRSLQPLREKLSLELVMADTGSDDGSRAVAARYADVLFDFPWINDFAAARNAVLERCTGRWALSLDADEWLDAELGNFADFLRDASTREISCSLPIRNYMHADLAAYTIQYAGRLLRMSARPRYRGAIHERPEFLDAPEGKRTKAFSKPFLHHDGYVALNDGSETGKAKRARNMALLRAELEKEPDNLRTLGEAVDSCGDEADAEDLLRHAVACVEAKKPKWELCGPALLRSAVSEAAKRKLPELDEWAALAERMFPDSAITRLDINYQMFYAAVGKEDHEEAILRGEAYLREWRAFRRGARIDFATAWGSLMNSSEASAQSVRVSLARQYARLGECETAYRRLREANYSAMSGKTAGSALHTAAWLYANTDLELELLLRFLWDGICEEKPNATAMRERIAAFLEEGCALFGHAREETEHRPAWRVLLPLAGRCPLGDAAALMAAETAEEADDALARAVANGGVFSLPPAAFLHALKLGAEFPTPDVPLNAGEADALAERLAADKPFLRASAVFAASAARSGQDLLWARALALAAVQGIDWDAGEDAEARRLLAALARAESAALAHGLAPEDEPGSPMHRFARHLANAYAVLFPNTVAPAFKPDVSGGVRGALAELKAAALAAPEQKRAIDWVLDEILRAQS